MQKFRDEWGIKRRLDLQTMTEKEAKEYCIKFKDVSVNVKKALIERIRKNVDNQKPCEWILAIKDKSGKVVGKLEIFDIGNQKAFLSISIPYYPWKQRYGTEAIDQIIKICIEQKTFDEIELEYNNQIMKDFVEKYSSIYDFSEQYLVKIA